MPRSSSRGINTRKLLDAHGAGKNHEVTAVLINQRIRQLCIQSAMVKPFNEASVQPCSYDLHLGRQARLEGRDGFIDLDLSRYTPQAPLMLSPGAFMLAESIEYIRLPDNVEAHLHLVSSRAREGLNHSLAGLIDCGYQGRPTLELKNILKYGSIPVYANLRIAQLTFFEYAENAVPAYRGRYFGDTHVSPAKNGQDLLHA